MPQRGQWNVLIRKQANRKMTAQVAKAVSGSHGVIGVPRAISAPRKVTGRARINAAIAMRFNWRKYLNAASALS